MTFIVSGIHLNNLARNMFTLSCLTSPRFHHPTHRFFPLTWHILLRPAPLAPGTSLGDQRIPYPTRGHGKHINGVAEGKSTSRAFLI